MPRPARPERARPSGRPYIKYSWLVRAALVLHPVHLLTLTSPHRARSEACSTCSRPAAAAPSPSSGRYLDALAIRTGPCHGPPPRSRPGRRPSRRLAWTRPPPIDLVSPRRIPPLPTSTRPDLWRAVYRLKNPQPGRHEPWRPSGRRSGACSPQPSSRW